MATPKDVIAMAKEAGAQIVDLRFTDLPGQVQHLSLPIHELTEEKFADGQPFDGSSVRGFQEIQESDMLLDLDPNTAYIDPFTKHVTLNITCFVKDPITGEEYSRDPRNIARKAELYLEQTRDRRRRVLRDPRPSSTSSTRSATTRASSRATTTSTRSRVRGTSGSVEEGTATSATSRGTRAATSRCRRWTSTRTCGPTWSSTWRRSGLTIEVHHHEVGTAGQAEIDMRYDTLLTTADNVMKYKYVVKNTAYQAGKTVTFMPKPLFMDNGSGMHTHQSLWTGGEPLFWDEVNYGGISDMARWYIGGLDPARAGAAGVHEPDDELVPPARARLRGADHARLLPAEPERLRAHPGRFADAEARSGSSSAHRILVQPVPGVQRDADGRPRRHQEQGRAARADRQGPLRPAARGEGERQAGARVDLSEVLDALEADHQWLLEGGVFTQDVIDTWIEYKRLEERDAVRLRPHPHEFGLYYDV